MEVVSESQMDSFPFFNLSDDVCPDNVTNPMNSAWVNVAFGQCITNISQWFAFWIGLSSIVFWMVAQFPQLVTNCRTGKADRALSFWFLLQWIIGDATNLVGTILANQLFTQLATAVYFVLMDCATMTQFLFHLIKNQGIKGLLSCFKIKIRRGRPDTLLAVLLPGMVFTVLMASQNSVLWTRQNPYQAELRNGRTLKSIEFSDVVNINDPKDVAGYILGWISAAFYVMSRVPQIVKNFSRCSVEGLSPTMFVLAILGNVTYGLGIFLYSVDPVFLLQRLPWLVGSVGTLVFDFIIMAQFLVSWVRKCYRNKRRREGSESEKEPLLVNTVQDPLCLNCFCKTGTTGRFTQHLRGIVLQKQ